MSAIQTARYVELEHVRADVADEEPRRPKLVLVASAFSECTCPGDCARDHDNE